MTDRRRPEASPVSVERRSCQKSLAPKLWRSLAAWRIAVMANCLASILANDPYFT